MYCTQFISLQVYQSLEQDEQGQFPAFFLLQNSKAVVGISAEKLQQGMNKIFLGVLLSLLSFIGVKAQTNAHRVCMAQSSESLLKFGLDYSDDTYSLLLRNIKGSTSVAQKNDKFIFITKSGRKVEAVLTEDVMNASTDGGYYKVVLTPNQVNYFLEGLASVSLERDNKTIPFTLFEFSSGDMKNEVKVVHRDSVQSEKEKVAKIVAEEKRVAREKEKEKYESWLANLTPEYLETIKNYSFIYGGYSYIFETDNIKNGNHGVTLGCLHAINLTKRAPVFIEFGGEVRYYHKGEHFKYKTIIEGIETKVTGKVTDKHCLLTVPVSVSYKFVHPSGVTIYPYLGFNLNLNVYNKASVKTSFSVESDDIPIIKETTNETTSLGYRKFQFGEQIGVRIGKDKWFGSVEYRFLMPYTKHSKIVDMFNATIGYKF